VGIHHTSSGVCQSILTPLHLFCLFVCFVYFVVIFLFAAVADAHGELATRVTQTGTSQGARLSSLSDRIDDVAKECLDTISMHANDVGQAVGRLERGTASSIKDAEDRLQLRVVVVVVVVFL
jgi:predicted PurR-regulated permease PerM